MYKPFLVDGMNLEYLDCYEIGLYNVELDEFDYSAPDLELKNELYIFLNNKSCIEWKDDLNAYVWISESDTDKKFHISDHISLGKLVKKHLLC